MLVLTMMPYEIKSKAHEICKWHDFMRQKVLVVNMVILAKGRIL